MMPVLIQTGALMSNSRDRGGFLSTLTGRITAITAVVAALSGLVGAVKDFPFIAWVRGNSISSMQNDCLEPYRWRLAVESDHVCVTDDTFLRVLQDNQRAASRRNSNGGPYGADTCLSGYVFRDAFPGDRICVEPETRYATMIDNQQGPFRKKQP
ncbi:MULTISPECIES: hypothetical protein [unclassified Rhizobium]|uniref:hypothetical protein n=1 Tax=unclassified Rhizobium TaxID=2613769 RepID=UPI0013C452D2|nr:MULTISPECIES: hypothetical protein [unclassified Rhizobium]